MGTKRRIRAEAKANAKIEASAKASFQRKKIITEVVPPDVSRAKAGAWLSLISPITEWAGLRGDALRYKRGQLRIQQEAALDALAGAVREKIKGKQILHPLPPKVFVPALEGASLEASDSPFIDWWAELLTKAAINGEIRPFLVDLMTKIGNQEASFLEEFWKTFSESLAQEKLPPLVIGIAPYVKGYIEGGVDRILDANQSDKAEELYNRLIVLGNELRDKGDKLGFGVNIAVRQEHRREFITSAMFAHGATLDVCRSLNLIETHSEVIVGFRSHALSFEITILHFSELGIEFMKACRPSPI